MCLPPTMLESINKLCFFYHLQLLLVLKTRFLRICGLQIYHIVSTFCLGFNKNLNVLTQAINLVSEN